MLIEIVKQRLREKHGDSVAIDESTYTGFKKRAVFIDVEYGRWEALVYAVARGTRHPVRARVERAKLVTFDEAKRRIAQKHEGRVEFVSTEWSGTQGRYIFRDVEFGEWTAHYGNIVAGSCHPERARINSAWKQSFSNEELQAQLEIVHDGVVKLIGPYTHMLAKTKFLDVEHGEFEAYPVNVLHKKTGHIRRAVQRREETSIKRFGCRHAMQNMNVQDKHIRSLRQHLRTTHWKTGIELYCINRWELAFVEWLNERREDFLWQPQTFKMPDGRTYRPDALLVERNLWIEIKGWYTETSRQKCEWFKTIMPNFEIWFKKELREHGIIS